MTAEIYLASRSPRRAEILQGLTISFFVISADVDESVQANESPQDYVLRLAAEKAHAGVKFIDVSRLPVLPILAADTTVTIDDMILGKPDDDAHAYRILKNFSGRWHEVHTAIAVANNGNIVTSLSSTRVQMAELSEELIWSYIATGEHRDKAGAYGIQGLASSFIKRIEGSYSGVMGLPIYETSQLLRQAGVKLITSGN